jgi:excinuclease ABC subunit A
MRSITYLKMKDKNMDKNDKIKIKGARTHNLKNIDLEMPRNKMIVFTGLSGSGKSSLAFDTIFAEGQRRYVESLSSYARQFLHKVQKPDVDEIQGLSPAISIDQKSRSNNPRSTVATITEIYDYLRVLYARIGKPHCLICGREIQKLSKEEINKLILKKIKKFKGDKNAEVEIYAPVVRGRKGEYYQLLYDYLNKGYSDARVDNKKTKLRERIELSKNKKHDIDILIDKLLVSEFKDKTTEKDALERLSDAVERSLDEAHNLVTIVLANTSLDVGRPSKEFIMSSEFSCPHDGYSFPEVEPRLFSFNSPYGACEACNGLGTKHLFGSEKCEVCNGARLRPEALNIFLGNIKTNISDFVSLSIQDAKKVLDGLKLTKKEEEISGVVLKEINARLQFMLNVGIEYLTLNRKANTLSGGEAQRIRLASQLGSGLVGALYVLDEPTIGLHQRDNDRLIKTLQDLRDTGNTIIVVEHDEDTIYASDYIVDIGPGAGVHGGEIVVSGWLDDLLTAKTNKSKSKTLAYLREEESIKIPERRKDNNRGELKIRGGKKFNIKNLNINIPLRRMVSVTGVSGSGKSTFLYELLYKNLRAKFDRRYRTNNTYNIADFKGAEYLSRAILIDQSPIGRTPRSNPATYTGAFSHIRDLFATSSEARVRGWKPGRFSFNVKGGRCETCMGNGEIAIEMHFLPTVYTTCDVCKGKRFMKETLEVKYKNKNIHEVLEMTIEEALEFFEDIPQIYDRLKTLNDVGLGYLRLGQSAKTLSGGEAQRVKISSELYRPHTQKTIYLLDEPTVGLHYEDVKKLIEILKKLVDGGNTVVVIEHNMDLIKSSDYVIDIGPEGGERGGSIVAKGTPEEVAGSAGSFTGQYLKKVLKKSK